jgi:hypothetical protein
VLVGPRMPHNMQARRLTSTDVAPVQRAHDRTQRAAVVHSRMGPRSRVQAQSGRQALALRHSEPGGTAAGSCAAVMHRTADQRGATDADWGGEPQPAPSSLDKPEDTPMILDVQHLAVAKRFCDAASSCTHQASHLVECARG